jgi:hypothetical protein
LVPRPGGVRQGYRLTPARRFAIDHQGCFSMAAARPSLSLVRLRRRLQQSRRSRNRS